MFSTVDVIKGGDCKLDAAGGGYDGVVSMPGVELAGQFEIPATIAPDPFGLDVGNTALGAHVDLVARHDFIDFGIVFCRLVKPIAGVKAVFIVSS